MLRACESLAFYRILFRHEHRSPITELDITAFEVVVIRKSVRYDI